MDGWPPWRAADADGAARAWVIAELGVNHDGDPRKLLRLVGAAAEAGADAIKLQLFDPGRLLSRSAELAGYQAGKADDAAGLLAGLVMPPEENAKAVAMARAKGMGAVATPFSVADVAAARGLGLDAVKIASPDCVNPMLLRSAAGLGLPMLVSTGAADLEEVGFAAALLGSYEAGGGLMHCVSSYPTPDAEAGLGGVAALRARYGLAVGYSDHTQSIDTGGLAVAAGAVVLEKHLTLDRSAPGPDHAASLDPEGFQRYVVGVRRAEGMVGPVAKAVSAIERDVRRVARQSVAAVRDLPAGRVLSAEDLTVMRPGTGVPAMRFDDCVGKTLPAAVKRGELLPTALLDG